MKCYFGRMFILRKISGMHSLEILCAYLFCLQIRGEKQVLKEIEKQHIFLNRRHYRYCFSNMYRGKLIMAKDHWSLLVL